MAVALGSRASLLVLLVGCRLLSRASSFRSSSGNAAGPSSSWPQRSSSRRRWRYCDGGGSGTGSRYHSRYGPSFPLPSAGCRGERTSRASPRPIGAHPLRMSGHGGYGDEPSDPDRQAEEAAASLREFHPGTWRGTARSFSVTQDAAAGVVLRRTVPYRVSVRVEPARLFGDYQLTETYRSVEVGGDEAGEASQGGARDPRRGRRTALLGSCRADVDSVDASYSLDQSAPDLPPWLVGRREALATTDGPREEEDDVDIDDDLEDEIQFGIEHCLATGANERVRSFLLYGGGPSRQLLRVVVCHEERVLGEEAGDNGDGDTGLSQTVLPPLTSSITAGDLLEMQSDIDRLVDRIAGQMSPNPANPDRRISATPRRGASAVPEGIVTRSGSNPSRGTIHIYDQIKEREQSRSAPSGDSTSAEGTEPRLSLHATSLLEASSGVWLGDAVVRHLAGSPVSSSSERNDRRRRGTGPLRGFSKTGGTDAREKNAGVFAAGLWEVGVQKVAWRWMWNFGDEIRQVVDAGRSLGPGLDPALAASLGGSVCVNEGLSRRVRPADRMVYVDWTGDNVGFLVGPAYVQAPRFHVFDRTRDSIRPFYTDLCVFFEQQRDEPAEIESTEGGKGAPKLPMLVCSKLSRVYGSDGSLKQGCTGFYSFQRFGMESDDPR